MNVDFKGYGENVATFIASSAVKEGDLVKINNNFAVTPCTANDEISGVCVGVSDGYAAVQLSGYVEVESNKRINLGVSSVAAASATQATTSATARKYNVIYSTDTKVGFIL